MIAISPSHAPPSGGPILVAVDFSRASESALLYGARLAGMSNTRLHVLHVVHESPDRLNSYPRLSERDAALPMEAIAARMLREFVDNTSALHPGLVALDEPETSLVSGLPAVRIAEVANHIEAGHIVLGKSRRSGFSGFLRPAICTRVGKKTTIPISTVSADGAVGKLGGEVSDEIQGVATGSGQEAWRHS